MNESRSACWCVVYLGRTGKAKDFCYAKTTKTRFTIAPNSS